MNNRWRHKIKLRRKYKKKKKFRVRALDIPVATPQEILDEFNRQGIKRVGWGDFLAQKNRPSVNELFDEYEKYMKSKEGDIDDSNYTKRANR